MPALTLNTDKAFYGPKEPIQIKVALSNTDSEPITVNKRLALNSPFAPKKFREIQLVISDEAGEAVTFAAKINLGFPLDTNFVSLAPGEQVERLFDIRRYFSLNKGGRYQLRAIYQNGVDPTGGEAWKGEVESAPVEVMVA